MKKDSFIFMAESPCENPSEHWIAALEMNLLYTNIKKKYGKRVGVEAKQAMRDFNTCKTEGERHAAFAKFCRALWYATN